MSVYQPSDEYLINCIKGGDIDKSSLLFERHYKNIYIYFFRLTRNKAESEDLTQNVFLRLIRFRNSYKSDHLFLPWIFKIAHHVFIDHCNYKEKEISNLNNYCRISNDETDEETDEGKLEVFYCAFEKIPIDYKELIILNRFHKLTYKQIGESLGLKERTVRQKAFRAIKRLRIEFEKLENLDK